MYQGNGHIWQEKFNRISDLMDRYYRDTNDQGARKSTEYRGALRNAARISYRVAKRTLKDMEKENG